MIARKSPFLSGARDRISLRPSLVSTDESGKRDFPLGSETEGPGNLAFLTYGGT